MGNQVVTDLIARNQTSKGITGAQQAFEKFGSSVKKVVTGVIAFLAVKKMFGLGEEWVKTYAQLQTAETRLALTMKNTGNAVGYNTAQLKAMREQMKSLSNQSDKSIMEAQEAMGKNRLIHGDQFYKAQLLALDLAETMGGDLVGAANKLSGALENPIAGLEMVDAYTHDVTLQEKALMKAWVESSQLITAQDYLLARLSKQYKDHASTLGGTVAGKIRQLSVAWKEIKEMLGSAIAPALEVILNALRPLTEWMIANREVVSKWGEKIVDAMKWIGQQAVKAFTIIETAFKKWPIFLDWAWTGVNYWMDCIGNTIAYFFTDVFPAYLKHFANYFVSVFGHLLTKLKEFLLHAGKNIKSFFEAVGRWRPGKAFDWEGWLDMPEGAQFVPPKMDAIADRVIGPLEKELGDKMDKMTKELWGTEFEGMIKNRITALGLDFLFPQPKRQEKKPGIDMTPSGKPFAFQHGVGGTGWEGLQETYKRIQSGAMKTPEQLTADATVKAVGIQQRMAGTLETIAANTAKSAVTAIPQGLANGP